MLAEQHEKPDDMLDNYFLPGEDDFEVTASLLLCPLTVLSLGWIGKGLRNMDCLPCKGVGDSYF